MSDISIHISSATLTYQIGMSHYRLNVISITIDLVEVAL